MGSRFTRSRVAADQPHPTPGAMPVLVVSYKNSFLNFSLVTDEDAVARGARRCSSEPCLSAWCRAQLFRTDADGHSTVSPSSNAVQVEQSAKGGKEDGCRSKQKSH